MWLLGFGVLTSFGAILSGQQEAIKSGEGGHSLDVLKAIQKHELIAQITTWSSLIIFSMVVPFF